MLRTHLKMGWRNIVRQRLYSAINVIGLGLGICACTIIYLIASYEFSFDRFHPDTRRIYRITGTFQQSSGERNFVNSCIPELAEIEHHPALESKAGLIFYYGKTSVPETENQYESGNDIVVTWPDYFRIFKYHWLAGDESSALEKPYDVVLSERKARKYFGNLPLANIIGKQIVYNDSLTMTVSGVVKDWSSNTDLNYTDFISIHTVSNSFLKKSIATADWKSLEPHRSMAFVKLNKHATAAQVNAQLAAYVKKYTKPSNIGKSFFYKLLKLDKILIYLLRICSKYLLTFGLSRNHNSKHNQY